MGIKRITWAPSPIHREMIESMVSFGIPRMEVARVFNVSIDTLTRHCKAEMDRGAPLANLKVAQFLFTRATGNGPDERANVAAAIFWAKTRMRWSEKIVVQDEDEQNSDARDVVPIPSDLSLLTEKELADLYRRVAQGEEQRADNVIPFPESKIIEHEPFKPRLRRLSDVN